LLVLFCGVGCSPASFVDPPSGLDETITTSTTSTTISDTSQTTSDIPGSLSVRQHDTIGSILIASWTQETKGQGHVEYNFDDDIWMLTPTAEYEVGSHEVLLLGIPYQTDVAIRLVMQTENGEKHSEVISEETADMPPGLPVPELVTAVPSLYYGQGQFLYTSINGSPGGWTGGQFWQVIIDRQGRVVWAMKTPDQHWTLWTQVSYDGDDLMWDESTVWSWASSEPSQVHRMKIDGTILESYETPGLHHAWDELADGSIIWGAIINSNEEWLQKLSMDGTEQTVWRCSDFEVEMQGETGYSCHSNSWWWHEPTDTYLVSFPSSAGDVRDTVLHIDNIGQTIDTWGRLGDWAFADEQTTFDYQHGVTFTETGNLLVSTKLHTSNPYYQSNLDTLAVREYALDYKTKTLIEVWSFGEDQGIAGNTAGEAHRLSNGNTLHNYGSGARTREITPEGQLVWDLKWTNGDSEGSGRLQGRSVFLEDLYDYAP